MTKSAIVEVVRSNLELQIVESEVHKTENFEYYLLDDPKANGKSKMHSMFNVYSTYHDVVSSYALCTRL